MKKLFLTFLVFLSFISFASDKMHLKALQNFNSLNPTQTFSAELIEDTQVDGIFLFKGDKINCSLIKIKDAKRAKIDAKAYFKLDSYENNEGIFNFSNNLSAKYATKIVNKESIKKTPKKKIAKTALSVAGGAFVEGAGYIVSFADGLITNNEGNRLKSGAKQLYEDSFLSYVERGDEINIKIEDTFYFIVKADD